MSVCKYAARVFVFPKHCAKNAFVLCVLRDKVSQLPGETLRIWTVRMQSVQAPVLHSGL